MRKTYNYIEKLLTNNKLTLNTDLLTEFSENSFYQDKIQIITDIQQEIMEKWKIRTSIIDFQNETIRVPNGTENIDYCYVLDATLFAKHNVVYYEFQDLESFGLNYDKDSNSIKGVPTVNGSFKIPLLFKVEGESESTEINKKLIDVVFNPDPKSLWKNIPSNKEAIFWKEENRSIAGKLKDKSIVISSKRGRSHQNDGSFRDDDFSYKFCKENEWTIVAVSDGAGSALFSREGSKTACEEIINYFENTLVPSKELDEIESKINEFSTTKDEIVLQNAKIQGIQALYKAVLSVHNKINTLAAKTFSENPELFTKKKTSYTGEYFHNTLIVALFKKTEIGYVIFTFGVGDCPIGIVNKDGTEARLLNWLDVGEFGGGTRFVTQPSIYVSKERPMSSRFNFHVQQDFSYLFLMTDGIYDPKFEVEANLEKTEKWLDFIKDLKGENEDNSTVDFTAELPVVEKQLNTWMDFWSKGNHDDRTLAIIF